MPLIYIYIDNCDPQNYIYGSFSIRIEQAIKVLVSFVFARGLEPLGLETAKETSAFLWPFQASVITF